ncbi:hypothetical protein H6A07_03625 [Olsenella uli]|uniref:hypothetical protein n=1 Tax=Olsenella uli TaxID=133926 RepID=UPI00195BADA4|nr:hypothetical protein [Olsenella uli]
MRTCRAVMPAATVNMPTMNPERKPEARTSPRRAGSASVVMSATRDTHATNMTASRILSRRRRRRMAVRSASAVFFMVITAPRLSRKSQRRPRS